MKPLLIATGATLTARPLGRREDDIEVRRVPVLPHASALDPARPTVVLLDRAMLRSAGGDRRWIGAVAERAAVVGQGDPGEGVPGPDFPTDLLAGYLAADAPPAALIVALRAALRHARTLVTARRAHSAAAESRTALAELTRAGLALATQRDQTALLATILEQARRITSSDAGSIYLVEPSDPASNESGTDGGSSARGRVLRCHLSQNHSLPDLPLASFVLPIDHTSLAGHAAATGTPLVIPDADLLAPSASYRPNRSFDERFGYRTKSVLVIPMRSQRDEVVGVLQLINRKRSPAARLASDADVAREVLPYDPCAVEHVTALAAQAAVSIENALLRTSIERLFDGFVSAAATAVEARDPGTVGHAHRVAALAVRIAEAVNAGHGVGRYAGARFTGDELLALRYAALLHDFGKLAVREEVLVKAKKLHPHALEGVRGRFAERAHHLALDCERAKVALLRRACLPAAAEPEVAPAPEIDRALADLDARYAVEKRELEWLFEAVLVANDPAAPPERTRAAVATLRASGAARARGEHLPLVTVDELDQLAVERGNLDEAERLEVEGHVAHTYSFLRRIPWTAALRDVPSIAHAHHEKPNGRGYPRQLAGDDIPVAARVLAVADIFDALTASDRPYKRATSVGDALAVMRAEAGEGSLDADLVETFVAARLFAPPAPLVRAADAVLPAAARTALAAR